MLLPHLKYEHINLSSFSKMRVDLAAQVDYNYIFEKKNSNVLNLHAGAQVLKKLQNLLKYLTNSLIV